MAKGAYIGVLTDVPIYQTVSITASNISTYFTVTNGTYYFQGSGGTFTTNNGGVGGSTASTKLTAKVDMSISFTYSYSSEANYDKFTLIVAGTTVANALSGATTSKTYSGSIKAGDVINFSYVKDGSVDSNSDKCTFSGMSITTQTGSESKGVARKIKKGYIGVSNFAKRDLPSGYTQVEYIQSSGTQCINTGFAPKYNSRVVMDVSEIGTSVAMVFGTRDTNSATSPNQFNVYRSSSTSIRSDYFGKTATAIASDVTGRMIIDKNANVVTAGGITITNTAVSSGACSYPLYLFAFNNAGSIELHSSYKMYSCQIYDNETLIRDYVPCINSIGTAGLYDLVSGVFYVNAGTGTFTVGTSAIISIARRIKKAYVGIGGVARPCWAGGELAYYGTTETTFTFLKSSYAATTVGNWALFGGGYNNLAVDAYNDSLTYTRPSTLSDRKVSLAATTVGNYALFGGGETTDGGTSVTVTNSVDAYDTSLTRTKPTGLGTSTRQLAATTVGGYALFGGGVASLTVSAYDESLTKTSPTRLQTVRSNLRATTVDKYALFGGGQSSMYGGTLVEAYDESLTQTTPAALSEDKWFHAATTVGDYALFGGGLFSDGVCGMVDVYDKSLTHTTTTLLTARGRLAATTLDRYALFGGGVSEYGTIDAVEVYDDSLVHSVGLFLGNPKSGFEATTVGNYALFGGDGAIKTVDVFTIV